MKIVVYKRAGFNAFGRNPRKRKKYSFQQYSTAIIQSLVRILRKYFHERLGSYNYFFISLEGV